MAKMTLLDIVQDILNDMDSDKVNSIDDTEEALQVAQIVETTFFEIIADGDWPHLGQLFQPDNTGSTTPTKMSLPDDVQTLDWFKYDKRTVATNKAAYLPVDYKSPEDFVKILNQRDSTASDIVVNTQEGSTLLLLNDVAPTYYTSFDNESIVCDSWDSDLETTILSSKSQMYGFREPTFSQTDTFTPDLPSKSFPYLLAEAKSTAFNALKQVANSKEEQRSGRQRRRQSLERWRHGGGITSPDYGRRGVK